MAHYTAVARVDWIFTAWLITDGARQSFMPATCFADAYNTDELGDAIIEVQNTFQNELRIEVSRTKGYIIDIFEEGNTDVHDIVVAASADEIRDEVGEALDADDDFSLKFI